MRCTPIALLIALTAGCGGGRAQREKAPLRIDAPSAGEIAACALAHEGTPLNQGTYTDRYGNTYAIRSHAALDQTLVETNGPGRGGPLEPNSSAPLTEPPLRATDPVDALYPVASPEASEGLTDPLDEELGNHRMRLQWPLPATGVTSLFGTRRDTLSGKSRYHYGVDLQGQYGQVVQASAPGQVVYAAWNRGHGRQVIIQHPGGWRTSYSHLAQQTVARGQWVRAGQSIGQVGNSGRSTGPHLHLEITRWGSYFDPLDVLGTEVAID